MKRIKQVVLVSCVILSACLVAVVLYCYLFIKQRVTPMKKEEILPEGNLLDDPRG
jgi:hypothetical protein